MHSNSPVNQRNSVYFSSTTREKSYRPWEKRWNTEKPHPPPLIFFSAVSKTCKWLCYDCLISLQLFIDGGFIIRYNIVYIIYSPPHPSITACITLCQPGVLLHKSREDPCHDPCSESSFACFSAVRWSRERHCWSSRRRRMFQSSSRRTQLKRWALWPPTTSVLYWHWSYSMHLIIITIPCSYKASEALSSEQMS